MKTKYAKMLLEYIPDWDWKYLIERFGDSENENIQLVFRSRPIKFPTSNTRNIIYSEFNSGSDIISSIIREYISTIVQKRYPNYPISKSISRKRDSTNAVNLSDYSFENVYKLAHSLHNKEKEKQQEADKYWRKISSKSLWEEALILYGKELQYFKDIAPYNVKDIKYEVLKDVEISNYLSQFIDVNNFKTCFHNKEISNEELRLLIRKIHLNSQAIGDRLLKYITSHFFIARFDFSAKKLQILMGEFEHEIRSCLTRSFRLNQNFYLAFSGGFELLGSTIFYANDDSRGYKNTSLSQRIKWDLINKYKSSVKDKRKLSFLDTNSYACFLNEYKLRSNSKDFTIEIDYRLRDDFFRDYLITNKLTSFFTSNEIFEVTEHFVTKYYTEITSSIASCDNFTGRGSNESMLYRLSWSYNVLESILIRINQDNSMSREHFFSYLSGTASISLVNIAVYSKEWDWSVLSSNPSIPWFSLAFEKYQDKLDWSKLSSNTYLPWTSDLILKYERKWNWQILSLNEKIPWSEELIERYKDRWCWSRLSKNPALPWSFSFIETYSPKWDAVLILKNPVLPTVDAFFVFLKNKETEEQKARSIQYEKDRIIAEKNKRKRAEEIIIQNEIDQKEIDNRYSYYSECLNKLTSSSLKLNNSTHSTRVNEFEDYELGRYGEIFIFKLLRTFKHINVDWTNKSEESYLPFDFRLYIDNLQNKTLRECFIDVKSSLGSFYKFIYMSDNEINKIKTASDYFIARVYRHDKLDNSIEIGHSLYLNFFKVSPDNIDIAKISKTENGWKLDVELLMNL
ncbi:protein NO VEIN domain-containing protein [Ancylomarina sp. YFZ004]